MRQIKVNESSFLCNAAVWVTIAFAMFFPPQVKFSLARDHEKILAQEDLRILFLDPWSYTHLSDSAASLEGCRAYLRSNSILDWRAKWIDAWDYELKRVSSLDRLSQAELLSEIRLTKEIYLKTLTSPDHDRAYAKLEVLAKSIRSRLDEKCPSYLLVLEVRAYLKNIQSDYVEARRQFAEVRRLRSLIIGDDNPMFATDTENVGLCAMEVNKLAESQECISTALEIRSRAFGESSQQALQCDINLAILEIKQKRYTDAVDRLSKVLVRQDVANRPNLLSAMCHHQLGNALGHLSKRAEAEAAFESALRTYRIVLPSANRFIISALKDQAAFYELNSELDKAKELRESLKKLQEQWSLVDKEARAIYLMTAGCFEC